jgi:predicted nucleotidyltransferase
MVGVAPCSHARVFGPVLHGLDTDSSDLGILIGPTPETTLFDIGAIRHELGSTPRA